MPVPHCTCRKRKRKLALTQVNFFLSPPTELPQAQVMHCLDGTGQPRQPSSLPTKSLEMWRTSWPHPPRITLLPSCDHAVHQTLTHTSQSPHCVQPRAAAPMINACFPEAGGCAVIAVGALEIKIQHCSLEITVQGCSQKYKSRV